MNKQLKDRLKYYCAGFYYSDIESKELCEDFKYDEPKHIKERIDSDTQSMLEFIQQLKKEGLI